MMPLKDAMELAARQADNAAARNAQIDKSVETIAEPEDQIKKIINDELYGDQNQKRDAGKSDPMMVEEDLCYALEAVNRVLDYGKDKYGTRGGWRKVAIERYRSAQGRHRRKVMQDGILARDDESDLLHLSMEVCNGLFLLQTILAGMTDKQRKKFLTYKEPPRV